VRKEGNSVFLLFLLPVKCTQQYISCVKLSVLSSVDHDLIPGPDTNSRFSEPELEAETTSDLSQFKKNIVMLPLFAIFSK